MEAREESQISVTGAVTFKLGIEGPIRVYQAEREKRIFQQREQDPFFLQASNEIQLCTRLITGHWKYILQVNHPSQTFPLNMPLTPVEVECSPLGERRQDRELKYLQKIQGSECKMFCIVPWI